MPTDEVILNPSPSSVRFAVVAATRSAIFVVVDADEHAELVAAEPVRLSPVGKPGLEPRTEPREQRVARRMPEAVVIRLEAVQVEQHQHRLRLGLDRLVEIADQRAPVPEPGQQVGLRLVAGALEQGQVVEERQAHAHEDCGERERR